MIEHHRQLFPALAHKTYFNYGGQGPLSTPALEAIQQGFAEIQRRGPFSQAAAEWIDPVTRQLRRRLAERLKVPVQCLSLTENVTIGSDLVLWGLDWQPGDQLLLGDCEHPGVVATARELSRRFGLELITLPVGRNPQLLETIAAALTPRTRLLVLSPVLWNTGEVLPMTDIVEICHQTPLRPVRVLADAAQVLGMLPQDLTASGVDFYAFTGHKWCGGPEGVGGLYVSPAAADDLRPTLAGWRGVIKDESGDPVAFVSDGRRLEISTSAYPLYAGLSTALRVADEWGDERQRYRRLQSLAEQLWFGLRQLDEVECLLSEPPASGLVSFRLRNGRHGELVRWLEQRGLQVRQLLSPNCVRACTHYLTLESEVRDLTAAIAEFSGLKEG